MTDPYEVMGLARNADPEAVRRRYLELVRQHTPEREPQRFAAIREAYDQLRDPVINLENRLFSNVATQTLDGLVAECQPDVRARRLPTSILLSLAQS
jgi:DnaJ-domain-containing protein 1